MYAFNIYSLEVASSHCSCLAIIILKLKQNKTFDDSKYFRILALSSYVVCEKKGLCLTFLTDHSRNKKKEWTQF